MASAFNEQAFEQKLVNLKDTQEAIMGLSTWCLQNKDHHKKIVLCWLHCLKRVKIEVRLSLFYLANDVIQHSKRKRYDFVESWGTSLQKATPLVRDEKVRERILRIFKIWEERQIYDEAFIADLCGLLTTKVKKKEEVETETINQNDFQPSLLVRKIKEIKALSENTDLKYKRIKDNKLPLTDAESMRHSLKDRRHGSDVSAEVDSGVKKMEAFVKALETEISSREKLVDVLREALIFYEKQRGEAKIVANAYRSFGARLRAQQNSINELIGGMPSPLPSPDVNAPSPSPDSDFDGQISQKSYSNPPISNGENLDFSFVNTSFIGSGQFLDISRELFAPEPKPDAEAQPIEVIGGREANSNFGMLDMFSKFLKPLKELQPPPMPPVFTDWSTAGPWDQPPPENPQSPPLYEKQITHEPPLVYDDSLPMPPLVDEDHRTLLPAAPMQAPLLDVDNRPVMNLDVPPPMHDIDHRNAMNMQMPMTMPMQMPIHSMDVPPPTLSDRAAIIPPMAEGGVMIVPPPNLGLLGPPPPPPAMQAFLDVDQRNLIRITGQQPGGESFHKEAVYIPPAAEYPPPRNDDYSKDSHFNNSGGYEPVFPSNENWSQRRISHDIHETDVRIKDNVESIDMDVSEGEEESQSRGGEFGRGRPFHIEPRQRLPFTPSHHYSGPPTALHKELPPPPHHEQTFNEHVPVQSAGAKLVAEEEQSYNDNGYSDGSEYNNTRPRWQSPRPPRGQRFHRPHFNHHQMPFRPRQFRPRGRW